jgi:hypothetical protein
LQNENALGSLFILFFLLFFIIRLFFILLFLVRVSWKAKLYEVG